MLVLQKKCIEFCSPDNWLCGAQHILHIFVVCLCGFVQPDEMKKEMSVLHMISLKQKQRNEIVELSTMCECGFVLIS